MPVSLALRYSRRLAEIACQMKKPKSNIIVALRTKEGEIATISLLAIGLHLIFRFGIEINGVVLGLPSQAIPLLIALICGAPLVIALIVNLSHGKFSSDLLAGISIVTSVILGEYLAGTLVVRVDRHLKLLL